MVSINSLQPYFFFSVWDTLKVSAHENGKKTFVIPFSLIFFFHSVRRAQSLCPWKWQEDFCNSLQPYFFFKVWDALKVSAHENGKKTLVIPFSLISSSECEMCSKSLPMKMARRLFLFLLQSVRCTQSLCPRKWQEDFCNSFQPYLFFRVWDALKVSAHKNGKKDSRFLPTSSLLRYLIKCGSVGHTSTMHPTVYIVVFTGKKRLLVLWFVNFLFPEYIYIYIYIYI